jgi:2-(1,2-epoxy-1,2-dihydrophenyl)acetyl-CoA isomerase
VNATTSTPDVEITRTGEVLRLVLRRPERRNAVTREMLGELCAAVEGALKDDGLRAVTIEAEGGHFCGGMDLAQSNPEVRGANGHKPPTERRPRITARHRDVDAGPHRLLELLLAVEVPVLAAVRGNAAGFGCALALAADLAVVSDTARFHVPYVKRGFTPDSGTTYLLPRLVGLARARRMLLLGHPVDAAQAQAWGLIDEAVPDAELETRFATLLEEVRSGPTVALGLTKWLLGQEALAALQTAMRRETVVVDLALRTLDFKEGVRAFLERREPRFEGR